MAGDVSGVLGIKLWNRILIIITMVATCINYNFLLSLNLSPSLPITIASFDMKIPVDGLFFTGIQLATISNTGRVAIWQSVQQHWQVKSSGCDGSFLYRSV